MPRKAASTSTRSRSDSQALDDTAADYNDKLLNYYKMKQKYESKKIKKESEIRCIICDKKGGKTIFEITKDKYLASCGKCNFEIKKQIYKDINIERELLKEKIKISKSDVILQALNTKYNFIDDKNTVEKFKKKYAEFQESEKELLRYDEMLNMESRNEEKKILIKEINDKKDKLKDLENIFFSRNAKEKISDLSKEKIIEDYLFICQSGDNNINDLSEKLRNAFYKIMVVDKTKEPYEYLFQKEHPLLFVKD